MKKMCEFSSGWEAGQSPEFIAFAKKWLGFDPTNFGPWQRIEVVLDCSEATSFTANMLGMKDHFQSKEKNGSFASADEQRQAFHQLRKNTEPT